VTTINNLKPDPKNARKRTERSATLIGESLKRYGAARSIVIDEDDRILAGNGTVEQAKAAGISKVRVVETDGDEIIAVRRRGLTDQDKIGLAIADNRTSDLSEWDAEMLRQLDAEYDLTPWFFEDEIPVEELVPAEGLTDPDDVPDVPEEPVTKPGDLYILGNHRLLCGDSTNVQHIERLMDGAKADMWITDPPYNVNYEGETGLKIQNDNMSDAKFRQFLVDAYTAANTALRPGAVFYIWHAGIEGYNFCGAAHEINWRVRQCLIWLKSSLVMGRQDYQWQHEPCLYGWIEGAAHHWNSDRKQTTILKFDKPSRSKGHPTMKPVALFEYQIANSTRPDHNVLDSFGGSGTTLIACERLLRHCRMMELDPAYCDVILRRYLNYVGDRGKVFLSSDEGLIPYEEVLAMRTGAKP
jgi:site-specific DNA-methyltransferase (adenine-specific)